MTKDRKEYFKEYYIKNKEKMIESSKAYNKANPDKIKEAMDKWVSKNPDKFAYISHKGLAKSRGVPFELTFEEWYNWWLSTGHYHERGKKKGQYVMARFNDDGAYSLDNIKCILHSENVSEGYKHRECKRSKNND